MNLIFNKTDKNHPLYNTWWNMIARCYFEIAPGFENYGGRGIRVANRWCTFSKFAIDMGGYKPIGLTLDRIDNDSNYSHKNCKWSSRSDQMLNRRQFKNNTSGETGVVKIAKRFEARFHADGIRYRIGRFSNVKDAKTARSNFIKLFIANKDDAIKTLAPETLWCTSETKVRGVSKHKDGGFIARTTKNGVRHYIGYFRTLEEAIDAKCEFDKD